MVTFECCPMQSSVAFSVSNKQTRTFTDQVADEHGLAILTGDNQWRTTLHISNFNRHSQLDKIHAKHLFHITHSLSICIRKQL